MAAARYARADPAAIGDRRVLFFGDSFVAGVGDPTGLGWVGRVVAASHAAGAAMTAYNLGVRGETSVEVAVRWRAESRPRMVADAGYGVVFSFGVNPSAPRHRAVRSAAARCELGHRKPEAAACSWSSSASWLRAAR